MLIGFRIIVPTLDLDLDYESRQQGMTAIVAQSLVCMLCRCFYHWAFTMIPGTLWMAWILSAWQADGSFETASSQLSHEPGVATHGKSAEVDSADRGSQPANSNGQADSLSATAPVKSTYVSAEGSNRWQGPRTTWSGTRIFTASQVPFLPHKVPYRLLLATPIQVSMAYAHSSHAAPSEVLLCLS